MGWSLCNVRNGHDRSARYTIDDHCTLLPPSFMRGDVQAERRTGGSMRHGGPSIATFRRIRTAADSPRPSGTPLINAGGKIFFRCRWHRWDVEDAGPYDLPKMYVLCVGAGLPDGPGIWAAGTNAIAVRRCNKTTAPFLIRCGGAFFMIYHRGSRLIRAAPGECRRGPRRRPRAC